jgi:histidinol-phosphate aminotransferase
MSPLAKQAVLNYLNGDLQELARYPDANQTQLKQTLAQKHALNSSYFTIGNGSNDVLEMIARTFVGENQAIMYAQYSFIVYALSAQVTNASHQIIPSAKLGHDLDVFLHAINHQTKIIYLANPNNPTGTFIHGLALKQFIEQVPKHILIVLDEAYTEYLTIENSYDSVAWLEEHSNLVIVRTLSKAYGLAALRVGYSISHPDISDLLNRVRQPFNVNECAQIAAIYALQDQNFLEESRTLNTQGYEQLCNGISQLGFNYQPSYANFVLIHTQHAQKNMTGLEWYLALMAKGVIIRPVANYGIENAIRVSIGLAHENQAFLNAVEQILAN